MDNKARSVHIDEIIEKPDGENYLLVIGIDKYKYITQLNNCEKDGMELVNILTEKYQFDPENVTTLFNKEANRGNILQTLEGYIDKLKGGDCLFIWFSGHGEIFRDKGYWVPVDAENKKRHQFISSYDLKERLEDINAFHIYLCVDACFAGTIFTSYRNSSSGNENQKSRLGLAASHSKEVALDGNPGENSPFAKHFLKNLRANEYDIGVHKLSADVMDDVRRETRNRQNPVFEALDVKGHEQGQFVLRLRGQNTYVDPRDGKVYKTIELNGKTWMAQNLDYKVANRSCYYANDPIIGKIFGRLYEFDGITEACPPGWRIPTSEEWAELARELYGNNKESINFRGNKFNLAFGGWRRNFNNSFSLLGHYGYYWAQPKEDSKDMVFAFSRKEGIKIFKYRKEIGSFSCRCIKI